MADNAVACRSSSVMYPHLPLSPYHFRNSLSTFSIERVNEIPLWNFCTSDFQRVLKIIIIAELFIVMTISPGYLRHNNSNSAEKMLIHDRTSLRSPPLSQMYLSLIFQLSQTAVVTFEMNYTF